MTPHMVKYTTGNSVLMVFWGEEGMHENRMYLPVVQ